MAPLDETKEMMPKTNATEKPSEGSIANLKTVVKGASIFTSGSLISQYFLSPLVGILNTRILGVETYGLFSLASNIIGFFSMFSLFGLHEGIIKFIPEYIFKQRPGKVRQALYFALKWGAVFGMVSFGACLLFTYFFAYRIFEKPGLDYILYFAAGTILLNNYQHLYSAFLCAMRDIKYRTLIKYIYPNTAKLIILIIVFIWGGGVTGVLLAVVISSLIQAIAGWYYTRTEYLPNFSATPGEKLTAAEKKDFMVYSVPLYFVLFVDVMFQQTDGLMIGYFMTASDVGIYEVSFRITPFLLIVLGSTSQLFVPLISEFTARRQIATMEELYKQVTKITFILTLPIYLMLMIFPEELLLIFGRGFTAGATCLMILSSGFLFQAITGHTAQIISLSSRSRWLFYSNGAVMTLNIVLNYLFIQWWGIIGAAVATTLSIIFINLIQLGIVYYLYRIHPYSLQYWKPIFAGLISGGAIYFIKLYGLSNTAFVLRFIAPAGILFLLYFITLLLLRLDSDERRLLTAVKDKMIKKFGIKK